MATDTLARYGQEPALLDAETVRKLDAFLPSFWSRSNPIDILGDASAERFRRVLEVCFDSKDMDGVLVILRPGPYEPDFRGRSLGIRHEKPTVSGVYLLDGRQKYRRAVEILNETGIPTYDTGAGGQGLSLHG